MSSIILEPKTKRIIEEIANKMLKPINGIVSISDDYSTIHCSTSWGNGHDRREYDEYWYRIKIKSNSSDHEYGDIFNDHLNYDNDIDLAMLAWNIAHNAWNKFDPDLYSELAENLWPKDNSYKPDYKRFL